ncbi:NAD(+) diphosphatase [Marinobacter orientalis]|uniref:NAD(+) diphosphatase n=1 Tax=Marinobacter orientalis TaxID=1928859 RepID=A0A7Y0RDE7_9GAMM|nr:NAD(+) diphosphatase [Marinobacter orientalis]NMT64183.1 NAD(+) diphosphatase [Marinobacter orientalis]TGX49409.1 NAD(+) diphosphatase [Marinobacter orientalis]
MAIWTPGWSKKAPQGNDLVLAIAGNAVLKPETGWLNPWQTVSPFALDEAGAIYVGQYDGQAVYVAGVDADALPDTPEPVPLRDAILMMEDAPADMLSTAFQVHQWWRDHRFCGRCGGATGLHPRERAKWCEACSIPWYPRLAPCVIVVIRRGDRMLLARSSRVKRHFFSLIAGFVEPGENIEAAVAREVKEETGLDVSGVRYQASQPWPFPHQLMLGFFADYAGGDLVLQEDEIAEAGWYRPDELPPVPPLTTISGQLIDAMARNIVAKEGAQG